MEDLKKQASGRSRPWSRKRRRRKSRAKTATPSRAPGEGGSGGLSVVCGSINQTCTRGPYRGSQCTTMAVMANARAKMQKPSEWTTDTINDIIYAGDALHTHLRDIVKISDHPDGRVSIDDILKQTELEFRVRDSQVILYPGEEIPSFLSTEMVVELQLFDVQEWINLMQKNDSNSGFLMTVGDFSYGLFNQDDQWVLFDSHGHLGQSCSGKIQLISRDRGALIVSASQLDKLIKILQDTHPGYGECQVATIDIKPVTPAISDHCSGDMGDSTPQEFTQQDAVETSSCKKEVGVEENEESCESVWDTFFPVLPKDYQYGIPKCWAETRVDTTAVPSYASMALTEWWRMLGRIAGG